jgi:hypothetical protein
VCSARLLESTPASGDGVPDPQGSCPRTAGNRQASSVVLGVPPGALPNWRKRLADRGVDVLGRAWAFGEECLCFTDPDGLELALALIEDIEGSEPGAVAFVSDASGCAITRIRSVEFQIEGFRHAARFLVETLGFKAAGNEGAVFRFRDGPSERPVAVDLLCTPTHRPGRARGLRTKEMMNKIDTNGDGMISKAEWDAFQEKVFTTLDVHKRGSLSTEIFVSRVNERLVSFATGGYASGLRSSVSGQNIRHDGHEPHAQGDAQRGRDVC